MMATKQERDALEKVLAADKEERGRADLWKLVPLKARQRALAVAGLEAKRAGNDLADFTPEERATIYAYVHSHVMHMEIIVHLMGVTLHPGVLKRATPN